MTELGFVGTMKVMLRARLKEAFGWTWATTVACLVIGKGLPPIISTIMAIFACYLLASGVYIYNDSVDYEFDMKNEEKKMRPIPSGLVSPITAKYVSFLLVLGGISLSYFINFNTFIISIAFSVIWMAYSYPPLYTKRRFLLKDLTIASGSILFGLLGMYAVINTFSIQAFFANLMIFIFILGMTPAIADTVDLEQDIENNVKSLAVMFTWSQRINWLVGSLVTIILLTPFAYFYLGYNILTPFLIAATCLLLIKEILPLSKGLENVDYKKTWYKAYLGFILTHIIFVIGSLNLPIPL